MAKTSAHFTTFWIPVFALCIVLFMLRPSAAANDVKDPAEKAKNPGSVDDGVHHHHEDEAEKGKGAARKFWLVYGTYQIHEKNTTRRMIASEKVWSMEGVENNGTTRATVTKRLELIDGAHQDHENGRLIGATKLWLVDGSMIRIIHQHDHENENTSQLIIAATRLWLVDVQPQDNHNNNNNKNVTRRKITAIAVLRQPGLVEGISNTAGNIISGIFEGNRVVVTPVVATPVYVDDRPTVINGDRRPEVIYA